MSTSRQEDTAIWVAIIATAIGVALILWRLIEGSVTGRIFS